MNTVTQTATDNVQNEQSREHAQQDQHITEMINTGRKILRQVETRPEVAETLASAGYDSDKLQEGHDLCDLLQQYFTHRQETLNQRIKISKQLRESYHELQKTFSDFRVTARALFKDSSDRDLLSVSGRRPTDREKLMSVMEAAFTSAQKEPYADTLNRHGFTAERFAAKLEQLAAFRELDVQQNNAEQTAEEATRIRDEAADELEDWFSSLRNIGTRALRGTPDAEDVFEA